MKPKLYTAGWNLPGYLPEMDPTTFTTLADAVDYLAGEMAEHAESTATWAEEHDCDDVPCPTYGDDCPTNKAHDIEVAAECFRAALKDGDMGNGATFHGGDLAYWVHVDDYDGPIVFDDIDTVRVTKYAWPGGYRVWYLTEDGASLCAECVQAELTNVLDSHANDYRDGWNVVGHYTEADTDEAGPCGHCGRTADTDND
jgi:hypothetical protein